MINKIFTVFFFVFSMIISFKPKRYFVVGNLYHFNEGVILIGMRPHPVTTHGAHVIGTWSHGHLLTIGGNMSIGWIIGIGSCSDRLKISTFPLSFLSTDLLYFINSISRVHNNVNICIRYIFIVSSIHTRWDFWKEWFWNKTNWLLVAVEKTEMHAVGNCLKSCSRSLQKKSSK